MADGFRIDLRKLGEKLPDGVQRAGRKLGKAGEKPLTAAAALAYPIDYGEDKLERLAHPLVADRLKHCTIETRAHVEALADLPGLPTGGSYGQGVLPVTLFRLRVERPDGDAEACVRQFLPSELLKLVPGSSLRALAHESDPRIVVLDWPRTAERLGFALRYSAQLEQYAWPDRDEWPAEGAIEIRDTRREARRLEERRVSWRRASGRLVGASSRGSNDNGRQVWKLGLEVEGTRTDLKARVPRLFIGRVIGFRAGDPRLGGIVETYDIVVDDRVPIPLLVSPAGELAVDWQALIDEPGMTAP